MSHFAVKTDESWRAGYEAALRPGGVSIFDRPDLGLLELTGRDRQAFLQGMVSNDVLALTPGRSCHAALLDSTAHLLADLHIHCLPESLLVEADVRCLERVARTLDKFLIMEKVRIQDVSVRWAVLSLLGEGAAALSALVMEGSRGFRAPRRHGAVPEVDVFVPVEEKEAVRDRLLADGAVPVTPDAWEVLRVEAGVPAWGHELDETVLLPEAGLEDAVSYTKGCYVGQEIVARISARGHANRALRALLLADGEAAPTPGDAVHLPESGLDAGREIGRVTSAVHSPKFGSRALALAYVRREHLAAGTPLAVHLRQPDGSVFVASGEVRQRGE